MVIPVLITLDIHSYPDTEKAMPDWIEKTLEVFDYLDVKATFLFPAIFAEQFAPSVRAILRAGHEVGCHGLTHGRDVQYNSLSYKEQKVILSESKSRIEAVTSCEATSFRAPVFKINGNTIRALEENGFQVDLSVNPQRLGIMSSEVTNTGWLYAPRTPYHPDFNNPFRKGSASLWEIPQSAFIFPFMSNTGIAFGELFMKLFYKILYTESYFRNNPIVYMLHPEEVYPRDIKYRYEFKWRHLFPNKINGFEFRYFLFHNKDGKKIARENINLLREIKRQKNVRFFTVKQIISLLETKN